jgi:TRAP-type mannitol/chloroaromatic compound transport system permease small subunit
VRLVKIIDGITELTGTTTAWLTAIMVVVASLVVLLRHFFGMGSIALQESVTYMHAMVFMLCCAYCLKRDEQVRVDILYRRCNPLQQAWINALGSLLLGLPLMLFIGIISWDFVMESWRIRESSTDSGGINAVYCLKSLLLIMSLSVSLQMLAELIRSLLILMNISEKNVANVSEHC